MTEPAVELRSVALDLGGHRVLDGISLSVAEGEKVALLGPSGAGKSSVLRCILGLEPVTSGQIRVFGIEVSQAKPQALRSARRRTASIFQQCNLFAMKTVLDNVVLGAVHVAGLPRAEARSVALRLLDRVGVGGLAELYPFQLSGGEQQRVAIARALATGPRLLLLDEPTSALDPEHVKGLLALIEELVADSGLSVVCVTHEVGFARRLADRVVFLAAGTIIEAGPPVDVLSRPASERVRAFLAAHQQGRRLLDTAPAAHAELG
jgi:ABC-type polar amino acid transport system ATPase subunit